MGRSERPFLPRPTLENAFVGAVRAETNRLCFQGDDRNSVDERGFTPLHDAADKGNTRVVDRLLQRDEVCMDPGSPIP